AVRAVETKTIAPATASATRKPPTNQPLKRVGMTISSSPNRVRVVTFVGESAGKSSTCAKALRGWIRCLPCLERQFVRAGPCQQRHHPVIALVTPRLGIDPIRFVALSLQLEDRKSTRLNSSHDQSSYAVFCLKKKKRSKFA